MNYIFDEYDYDIENKYRSCVVIHLYYHDDIYKFAQYISNIPDCVDIIFTYSSEKIYEEIKKVTYKIKNNIFYIKKENRGRDVSAFLVAARKKILEYDIFCFIHDKKSKNKVLQNDTDEWTYSLWENSLSSKKYIKYIMYIFENNSNVGVLTPPLYFGKNFSAEIIDQWGDNYKILKKMLIDTGVKKIPPKESAINAFGTVFWARKDALIKLLSRDWQYEDFDKEPLADDGTISHAIERSIWFYAQDAGYECHSVMTKRYADAQINKYQKALLCMMKLINDNLGCWNLTEIEQFEDKKIELKKFCSNYEKIYIYGAGINGRACLKILRMQNIFPEAFIVSSRINSVNEIDEISVIELNKCKISAKVGIIVAVSKKNRNDIIKLLCGIINKENIFIY